MTAPFEPVPDALMTTWARQLTRGDEPFPAPATERQREVLTALKADIAKIIADGGIVELPFDWPG